MTAQAFSKEISRKITAEVLVGSLLQAAIDLSPFLRGSRFAFRCTRLALGQLSVGGGWGWGLGWAGHTLVLG